MKKWNRKCFLDWMGCPVRKLQQWSFIWERHLFTLQWLIDLIQSLCPQNCWGELFLSLPFTPLTPFFPFPPPFISSPFRSLPTLISSSSHPTPPPKAYQNCLEQNSSQNVSMFPLLLDITSHPLTLHLEVITYEGLWGNIAALNPETWIFHKLISGDLGFKKLKLHQKYPTGSSKHWKLIKIVSLSLWLHWNIYHVDVQAIHYGYLNVFLPIIISVIQRERDRSFSQAPNQHDFYTTSSSQPPK